MTSALSESLLHAVTAGVLQTPPWRTLVDELKREFQTDHANITFRRPDAEQSFYVCQDGADLRARYYAEFRGQDPIDYFGMKPGRAYLLEEFVSDENGGPFLHEFLRPAGIHHYMLCYSEEPSGYRAWLSLGRGPGAEPFSAACREKLEAVSRHFRTALEVFAVLNRTQFDLEVHSRATAALSFGTITLDQSGRFLTADAGARLQLTGQTMLQVRSERLRLSHRELDAQLQKTIQALLRQPGGSRFMSLNLGEDAGLELLLCAPERRSAWLSAATPTLMVYLRSTGDSPQPEIGPIAELFQLGNREAQLASLLACGKTLSEAAEELHITESTARTYSKRIFEKTGVRRQTDLVRRILTSVAPLAMARSR